ncbi:MAG: hypothetical protein QM757_26390 [Paludibaculum sp.]
MDTSKWWRRRHSCRTLCSISRTATTSSTTTKKSSRTFPRRTARRLPARLSGAHCRRPPKISTAAQDALANFRAAPTPKKPSIWQRLAAGALGAAAGYSNADGRAGRIDTSAATQGILQPGLKREQAQWSSDYDRAQRAAQGEQRSNQQSIAGYRAQVEAEKAASDAKVKGAQADYYRKRGEAADAGEWKNADGTLFHSKTGATKPAPVKPPAYARPGYAYPKLDENNQPVRAQNGDVLYDTPVPAPKKETHTTSAWSGLNDPDPAVRAMAKRSIEAETNRKDRSGEPRPVDPIEREDKARTLVSKEQDSAYKNAEAQRTHELDALNKQFARPISELRKAGKHKEAAALEADQESKRQAIEKSHIDRKNAIEQKLGSRRKQLRLSTEDSPAGQYDDDGSWKPFGSDDLEAPDPIDASRPAPAASAPPAAAQPAPPSVAPTTAPAPPPAAIPSNPYRKSKPRV